MAVTTALAAGKLRHRITFQRLFPVPDRMGGVVETWQDVVSTWAQITPVMARTTGEHQIAGGARAQVSHELLMRYLPGIVPTMRVRFGSRTLSITQVINEGELSRTLKLLCQEEVP